MSNTLSGWLAHDYVHGRSPFNLAMRGFGELVGGMSTTWWSMKHNMHHAVRRTPHFFHPSTPSALELRALSPCACAAAHEPKTPCPLPCS